MNIGAGRAITVAVVVLASFVGSRLIVVITDVDRTIFVQIGFLVTYCFWSVAFGSICVGFLWQRTMVYEVSGSGWSSDVCFAG